MRLRPSAIAYVVLAAMSAALTGCGHSLSTPRDSESVLYQETLRTRGFDPAKASDATSAQAVARIYETLLQYDYLARPYTVVPLLSDGMPEISEDGLTYRFKVRQGIYFQDDACFPGGKGREVTADDFVYAIKRVADSKVASGGWWAFNGRIVGLNEFRDRFANEEKTDYGFEVSGLRSTDRHTLQIQLKDAYPQLQWIMAMHYAAAVPREAVEFYGDDFVNHPVGSGPFVLKSWIRNYKMEFVRNPKWRETGRVERYPDVAGEADAGKQIPFIDRIVDYIVADTTTKWLLFLTGQIDGSEISRDNWDVVMTGDGKLADSLVQQGIQLHSMPTLRIGYIGFNMDDPVVGTNKKLRQALSCGFESKAWEKFYNNRIRRPNGPIPEGLPGYDPSPSPYDFNLEKARSLLAEAGYPGGQDPATGRRLQITIESGRADDPEARQSLELVTAFFERIGVVLLTSFNNGPTFYDKLDRRQAQLYALSWLGDYPDAENFLQCFYGANSSPGPNHSNYVNPEFDRLYEKARSMQDTPERTELYRTMAAVVVEDCPWIFTSQPISYVLHSPAFKNFKPTDFPYGMEKYYRIDRKGGGI